MYSAVRAARRKPLEVVAAVAVISAVLGALTFDRLFSLGIDASLENTRDFERAAEPSLKELREVLRTKLTADSRARAGLKVLDIVLHAATPLRKPHTFWDKVREDFLLQNRRTTETMPKDDLRNVP
jgi:hypothetical protein